jgi:hypothetical protein
VPKVHNNPIKRPRKGSNKESKRHPKRHLGLAHRTVSFGKFRGCSAIIHRTVRCASGAMATSRATVSCNRIQCATVRAEVPEAPQVRAPTVEPQRSADVAGAPDCPVAHRTVRCAMRQQPSNSHLLVVGAINTPTTPHSMASKFLHFYTLQEL